MDQEPDPRSDCLVFGFIRSNSDKPVPEVLCSICLLLFYDYTDCWDLEASTYPNKMAAFNKMIRNKGSKNEHVSEILKRRVNSGHYFWKFRFGKRNVKWNRASDSIGIIPSSEVAELTSGGCSYGHGYGFVYRDNCLMVNRVSKEDGCISWALIRDYAKCIGDNDILEMHLDIEKLELSYVINGKNYGKAYKIKEDEYRAVVTMSVPDESWTLEESNFISYL